MGSKGEAKRRIENQDMKRPCNHRENKEQMRAAEKLTISLYQSDYQWLSLYFLRIGDCLKCIAWFCWHPRNFLHLAAPDAREPWVMTEKPIFVPQSKALSLPTWFQWNLSLLEDLARTLRPPTQQDLLGLWHVWYGNLSRTREILFPSWLLWQLSVKHLVIKGLHVLPKSFGKEKQNLYLVLFQMWSYKLLLCSIK